MEYVVARWDDDPGGYWLDPTRYLDVRPSLAERLPPGARAFATAPGDYDFYGLQ